MSTNHAKTASELEQKVLKSIEPTSVSKLASADIDKTVSTLTELLAAATKEEVGESHHFTHSRTHRLDQRLARKQKQVNQYRKKHWSRLNTNHSPEAKHLKKLKQESQRLVESVHETRAAHFSAQLKVEHKLNNKRRVTTLAKEFTKPPGDLPDSQQIGAIRDHTGVVRTNTREIHEIFRSQWGAYFTHPGKTPFRTEMKDTLERVQCEFSNRPAYSLADLVNYMSETGFPAATIEQCISTQENVLSNHDFTLKELLHALHKIDISKAAGLDRMAPAMVKPLEKSKVITENILLPLFNKILRTGHVPDAWKLDRRVPLEKKGDHLDVMNFRPIAIHSTFRKVLCTMIERRERAIVSATIDRSQYGFMPHKRASDLAALLNDIISYHHSTQTKGYVAVIDFRKAFDSCHIPTILDKKARKGITGRLLQLTAALYTNARAQFMINDKLGKPFEVTRGVAQGCVMSPLAFNIYVDDLLHELSASKAGFALTVKHDYDDDIAEQYCSSSSFVDDLVLVADSSPALQRLIGIVSRWSDKNFFRINVGKEGTGVLHIGHREHYKSFYLHGQELRTLNTVEHFSSFRYLGFLLRPDGRWNDFADRQLSQARSAVGQFHDLLTCQYIPFATRIELSRSLIVSKLAYGADIVHLNSTYDARYDMIWTRILRKIFNPAALERMHFDF